MKLIVGHKLISTLLILVSGFGFNCIGKPFRAEDKFSSTSVIKRDFLDQNFTRTSRQQRWPFMIYGGCSPPSSKPFQPQWNPYPAYPPKPISNLPISPYGPFERSAYKGCYIGWCTGHCTNDILSCLPNLAIPVLGCNIDSGVFCCVSTKR